MASNLIICSDLFFTSKVSGTAQMLEYDCLTVMSGTKALSSLEEVPAIQAVVIDLTTPGLNLNELISAIPKEVLSHTIAFGPHVEREALQQAEELGCAAIFTRSQFTAELPDILQQYLVK